MELNMKKWLINWIEHEICFLCEIAPHWLLLLLALCFTAGLLCHLDDACVSNPCNEGAVCDTNPLNGRAICTCPAGFVGGACNQDMDECSIGQSVVASFFFFSACVICTVHHHFRSLEMYETASFNPQVPIHVSILGNVSTQKAPSSASVVGVMLAPVVKLTSMNVCPCPAKTMPLASTASESSLASACQV